MTDPRNELASEAETRAMQFIVGTVLATITLPGAAPTLNDLRKSVSASIRSATLDEVPEENRELYRQALYGAVGNVFAAALEAQDQTIDPH